GMESIKIWSDNPDQKQLAAIASVIERGEPVIIPTDSVYAIVCDALNAKAIEKLCALKGIDPDHNTLSMICSGIGMASEYTSISDESFRLIKANSPAPVTYILKTSRNLPKVLKSRKEIGIRIPALNTPRAIVDYIGHPVLSTTIELDDPDYLRDPELIGERYEGRVGMIVDGGEGESELSTVVDVRDGFEIVRQGKYQF
ncbi:MAG: threonylcarbamoyl-AMP synthase, partial [Muribaculaceae bacterium]|nr:threonylcarbamoyl-AMP synthase [Muribaculaceae bacterium]